MFRRSLAGLSLCLLLCAGAAPRASAQTAEKAQTDLCRDRIVEELSFVHDEYRSVLFGSREDDDGKWMSLTGGEVFVERKGIFETRYRDTHDLIWPAMESYRVMRCRALYVCETVKWSFPQKQDESNPIDLDILGCAGYTDGPYDECRFGDAEGTGDSATITTDCKQLVEDSLSMEQSILQAVFAYDSSYRAALQFVGMTDWMMKEFPDRAFIPLRGMVNMLGRLYQIPCFLGQCDMPDNSDIDLPGGTPLDPDNPDPDAPTD